MRVLFIGALAATLVGCTHGSPSPSRNAARINLKPVAHTMAARSTIAANTQIYSSAKFDKKTKRVVQRKRHPLVRKRKPLPPAQLNKAADPVTEKAKAAIAAMMENPASAKFGKIKRAVKTLLGERLDTMCGHVKGKNALGEDIGEMPFLYIVGPNEAYLVDGSNLTADSVYRALCN